MSRQSYAKYRPSGVEWLGDLPCHWAIQRVKFAATLINDKTAAGDAGLPYVGLENVESWTGKLIGLDKECAADGISNRFAAGDVLFGKLRPYLAKALEASCDGVCSSEILVLRPCEVHSRYLLYFVLSRDFVNIVDSSTYGAKMPRASWDFIGNLSIPIPPSPEQQVIAAFLDRQTGKIDALVEKKRRLIELLKEKRAALISHAVTKGLNPNVPMKDSGIEWLGMVPEGWEIVPLRHLAISIQTGPFGSQLHADDYRPGGVPVVNPVHLVDGRVVGDEGAAVDNEVFHRLRRHALKPGDILFARRGEIGRCGLVEENQANWLCGTGSMRVRLDHSKCVPRFLNFLFNSNPFGKELTLNAVGTTMLNINNTILARMCVAVPPCREQWEIVDCLQESCFVTEALITRVTGAISRLLEYRTALISAAVTGKIDVRGEAAG